MSTLAEERIWMSRRACTNPRQMAVPLGGAKATRYAAVKRAKAICAGCQVLTECRDWALAETEPFIGIVVGGMSPDEQHLKRQAPAAKAVWMGKRQEARCGTMKGYSLHSRNGTTPCESCADAYRRMSCPTGSRR